tara:strand:+ start:16755 stop:17084 length:330 start_codon:yes stop_codon:yes gene_type:complete
LSLEIKSVQAKHFPQTMESSSNLILDSLERITLSQKVHAKIANPTLGGLGHSNTGEGGGGCVIVCLQAPSLCMLPNQICECAKCVLQTKTMCQLNALAIQRCDLQLKTY